MYNDSNCSVMAVFGEEEGLDKECHTIVRLHHLRNSRCVSVFIVLSSLASQTLYLTVKISNNNEYH